MFWAHPAPLPVRRLRTGRGAQLTSAESSGSRKPSLVDLRVGAKLRPCAHGIQAVVDRAGGREETCALPDFGVLAREIMGTYPFSSTASLYWLRVYPDSRNVPVISLSTAALLLLRRALGPVLLDRKSTRLN